jgi:hypothetical protein
MHRLVRHVARCVVLILAGLPLSATWCVARCGAPVSAAAHAEHAGHGSAHHGAASADAGARNGPDAPFAQAPPAHGCDRHDAALRDAAEAPVAARADARLVDVAAGPVPAERVVLSSSPRGNCSDSGPPRPPSHRAPLELRI